MAKLYFRYGAMNCGKTTMLIQTAFNYEERDMEVVVWKPKCDTKGEGYLQSRIGLSRKVDHLIEVGKENLRKYFHSLSNWQEIACILVDEAQFLSPSQIDDLLQIANLDDIPVMCYGIRTDFQLQGFLGSARLLLVAEDLQEIKTICSCGRKATTQVRKVNGIPTFQGDQVAIDGKDQVSYESYCQQCYFKLRKEYDREWEEIV